ncbi:MAG TPA: HAD family phosphatase [Chitinophagaceae bacterium]|nr:HAD family phosphatase [Chitinophagaceae bacterium]
MKATTLIFDLGGVILDIDYHRTRRAFEKLGVKDFNEMYSQAGADDLFMSLEKGAIEEKNFYSEIRKRSGLPLTDKDIRDAWNAILLHFREMSLQRLNELQLKYKLFLLSNTNHIHLREFNRIYHLQPREKSFDQHFEKAYYSCKVGMRKPNANIYELVLRENDLVPAQTVFIDDSAQNIDTAKSLGIQAILLKPGTFIEDLGL